ncbi:predicted protein [Lichtheimia corymbifera JMRC:FSU:9682]|uniref:Invertebrate defensins family profile domain-containing protein n=2 Tax=Lichtheimia TaxID=688353 RepID=A0A068S274_9FUNG|nr:uncharacterized protein O0I10_002755 [Lichtheimia ornata]KAJ8661489.1 hypothetical protein O0I10_002755 [Lichtheimia ornata]CDH56065.1 predicted protein [Lichtheimia corymbifera JMRC:FSU:9682]
MVNKIIALLFVLSMIVAASASPALDKRSSCQLGGLWDGGADALCSAHCIKQGNKHGGHCNKKKVCVCN